VKTIVSQLCHKQLKTKHNPSRNQSFAGKSLFKTLIMKAQNADFAF